ncbi:hypothetical protein [Rhodocyclus tenuis]|uniref:Uncharacterized protein n=1 Tax=Rhodocyclus tenuis TaxID=1066 RepID=A0A840G4Q0_RHOTE|nr:hypothetical protein [Rhodocyclus tenuis]MBB4246311.1 hypothetical protein [Rhodocyclus tenuis]
MAPKTVLARMRHVGKLFSTKSGLRALGGRGSRSIRQSLTQWTVQLRANPWRGRVRGRVLILASRNATWIEWALYAACMAVLRGWRPTLLVVRKDFRRVYPAWVWHGLIRQLESVPEIDVVYLEDVCVSQDDLSVWLNSIAAHVASSVAYDNHVEEAEVLSDEKRYGASCRRRRGDMVLAAAVVNRLLTENRFDRLWCYSGLIDTTPGVLAAGSSRRR